MKPTYLQAGKIVNTHGIRGEVRVYPLCDSAEFLLDFDRFFIDGAPIEVKSIRLHKNVALIQFQDVDTVEKAEKLIGKEILICRDDIELEDGRYFIEDLKGMRVLDVDNGTEYGVLTDIIQTGANDIYEVKGERTYLVPKIDSVVIQIDPDKNEILIRPLKGLFDL